VSHSCPRCGGAAHRSRTRSWFERVRRSVTGRVPYRCRQCNWRGWLEHVSDASQSTTDAARRELTDAELEELEPEAFKGDET
jgi:hypothetical protein